MKVSKGETSMTVATKTKQKINPHPHISQIKFNQQLKQMVWKFRGKFDALTKSTPQYMFKSKQKIKNPDKVIELER
jgi:hypothetical protein